MNIDFNTFRRRRLAQNALCSRNICRQHLQQQDSIHSELILFQYFQKKKASAKFFVQPQYLPRTSSAARFHTLRTYFQVQSWGGSSHLSPFDYCWVLKDNAMYPLMTDLSPAPIEILKMVKCAFKTDCSASLSTCRKNG